MRLLGKLQPERECDEPVHIARIISPTCRTEDELGLIHPMGALQRRDLALVLPVFDHREFVTRTFIRFHERFANSEGRIHQFHKATPDSFVLYGTIVTDGENRLVDFCVQSGRRLEYSRQIIRSVIGVLCVDETQ
ncbi:hypothetical protein ACU4GI_21905 [Cupriavidus basilensis]